MGKMIVFLDTNVVVDFIAHRERFAYAARIVDMASNHLIRIAISTLTFVNTAYIMRKNSKEEITHKLHSLYRLSTVPPILDYMILSALQQKPRDFEDFIQYQSAIKSNADIIITNDAKGFEHCTLPVMTPEEFIAHCS